MDKTQIILFCLIINFLRSFISSISINHYKYIKVTALDDLNCKLCKYSKFKTFYVETERGYKYQHFRYAGYIKQADKLSNGTYILKNICKYEGNSPVIHENIDEYDIPIVIVLYNPNKHYIHFNFTNFVNMFFTFSSEKIGNQFIQK